MKHSEPDRRQFLRGALTGAAGVAAWPAACTPSQESDTATGADFAAAFRAARSEQERWQVVRDQFLLEPGYAYFNAGGLGPSPQQVIAAVDEAWRSLELRCETGHGRRAAVRTQACEFFGCGEDTLAFTRNATEGMNMVARGLQFSSGDEVVMTTHEHPGGALPWFALREDTGIRIRTIDPGSGGDDTLERVANSMTARTRVVMVSHITCTTGMVMPVPEIADLCRRRGVICVIDGAQAVGQVPVDLRSLGCDFYVASGHKWLLAPKGTGLMYVREEMLDGWRPSYVGAYSDTGFDLVAGTFNRLRPASASEYGTRSTPVLLGVAAAMDFLTTIGVDNAAARAAYLANRLRAGISPLNGVEILTPVEPGSSAAILAFKLPEDGGNPWDWCNLLRREHSMRLRPVGEAGLNAVRASTDVFNSEAEVDRLVEVLGTLL